MNHGDVPVSVGWSIGTSPYGMDVSYGFSSFANTSVGNSLTGYPLYESTFALNGSLVPGITYWLTLAYGTSMLGGGVWWCVSDGPSSAYISPTQPGYASESFQLYSAVPEPTTCLSGLGALLVAGNWLLRKRG
jgi:hypothetical protein